VDEQADRRQYLQWVAAGGTVGIAGCSDTLADATGQGSNQVGSVDPAGETDLRDESSGDWRTFGGDLGNSGRAAGDIPSMKTLRHQWTADYRSGIISIEGFGAISADGRVFSFRRELDLDTAPSKAIVALEADTGELQWVSELDFDGAMEIPVAPNSGTVVDDTLYVCALTTGEEPDAVLALAADTGEVRWMRKVDCSGSMQRAGISGGAGQSALTSRSPQRRRLLARRWSSGHRRGEFLAFV